MSQFRDSLRKAHVFPYRSHRRAMELVKFMDEVSGRLFCLSGLRDAWKGKVSNAESLLIVSFCVSKRWIPASHYEKLIRDFKGDYRSLHF